MADDSIVILSAGCPQWGELLFENGQESYGNIIMSVKEVSPPGISGVAVMPLGLTKRIINVSGTMVAEGAAALAAKQELYEAACQTFTLDKYITGNARVFDKVRFVNIIWNEIFGDASGGQGVKYSALLEQLVPPTPVP